MRIYTYIILAGILLSCSAVSETIIKGRVADINGNPLPGVNVYIKDSYDGATSDSAGNYQFEAFDEGEAILVASLVSYKKFEKAVSLNGDTLIVNPALEEKLYRTDAVTVSAGAFEAGDEKKSVIFSSLDVATTAGAGADIYGAFQTLPGAGIVGESEGLFVRGGSGREAVTIIDGLEVPHPYYSSIPDISGRGRFSPFLFKGAYFSSGGYSAEYGQGMSSALVLNSVDLPPSSFTSVSLMSLGLGAGHTERWENTSLGLYMNYFDLRPYYGMVKQNVDWDRAPVSGDAALVFRHKTSETGMLKSYGVFNASDVALYLNNPDSPGGRRYLSVYNENYYQNMTYEESLSSRLRLYSAASFSYNADDLLDGNIPIYVKDNAYLGKVKMDYLVGELSALKFGAEGRKYFFMDGFDSTITPSEESFTAGFIEADIYASKNALFRIGGRAEYSELVGKTNFAPRASFAYKTGENSQISLAYGQFFQKPERFYLYGPVKKDYEKATHYIANYQAIMEKRIFRVEAYYKNYDKLIKTEPAISYAGSGDAKGIDFFWRDKETLKYADYWVSYSYLDTERDYLDYPNPATPDFAAEHTFSIVFKRFFPDIFLFAGFSYNYASGRPYNNPNTSSFMSSRAMDYHKLNLNFSYLTSFFNSFTVITLSIDNILGRENIHTYRYSEDGMSRIAVKDPILRPIFLGVFISFGRDNTEDI